MYWFAIKGIKDSEANQADCRLCSHLPPSAIREGITWVHVHAGEIWSAKHFIKIYNRQSQPLALLRMILNDLEWSSCSMWQNCIVFSIWTISLQTHVAMLIIVPTFEMVNLVSPSWQSPIIWAWHRQHFPGFQQPEQISCPKVSR